MRASGFNDRQYCKDLESYLSAVTGSAILVQRVENRSQRMEKSTLVKRAQTPEPSEPSLKESPESARAKLEARVKSGWELKARRVSSEEEAQTFNKDYQSWDEYNNTLLVSLFTSDASAREYSWFLPMHVRSYQDSDHYRYEQNVEALEKKCHKLESIAARIELYQLAPGVAVSRDAAAGGSPADSGVPSNPISLLETICLRFNLVAPSDSSCSRMQDGA